MQEKFLSGVLLVAALVAIANTASVDLKGWAASLQKFATINFYKQILIYQQAVLQEGIPALNVPPFDPLHIDAELTIFQDSYEMYRNIEIVVNGFNVSDFSYFDIVTAELDVEAMKANLSLYQDHTTFTSDDVRITAVDAEGNSLSCNCTYLESGVQGSTFNSVKQLEVVGNILQVKRFDLIAYSNSVYVGLPGGCTGDVQALFIVTAILTDRLADLEFNIIPEKMNELAANITIVLNDIFALRNITYEEDTMSTDHSPLTEVHQQGNKLPEVDSNKPDKTIRRTRTRADQESMDKVAKKNPIIMTWT